MVVWVGLVLVLSVMVVIQVKRWDRFEIYLGCKSTRIWWQMLHEKQTKEERGSRFLKSNLLDSAIID